MGIKQHDPREELLAVGTWRILFNHYNREETSEDGGPRILTVKTPADREDDDEDKEEDNSEHNQLYFHVLVPQLSPELCPSCLEHLSLQ